MNLPQSVLFACVLLSAAVLFGELSRRVHLPLTVVLALVGFVGGWLVSLAGYEFPFRGPEFEQILVFLFMPVLVFQSALDISTRAFVRNLVPILVLAVPALVASAAIVGVSLYFVLGIPLAAAFLFGALISATDPVAVIAIFRKLGVPERLLIIVEGESLLNDGVAIVLSEILLAAALGQSVSPVKGVVDFLEVFFGGALIGAVMGLVAAFALPWMNALEGAALSVVVAYGSFVLTQDVFGFSGVMATVLAGLVVSGFAPSRASASMRDIWQRLWEALDYIANALLFLLIGLAIDPVLIAQNLWAIPLAIIAVVLSRAVVVPVASALERLAGIPPVGLRTQAVLVWGGLRGGVALALALSLPPALPQSQQFVALTGGVVLATLLLNATTIGRLVHSLGLDKPTRVERFLEASARLAGTDAARDRLRQLDIQDSVIEAELTRTADAAHCELEQLNLSTEEERDLVTIRGLFIAHDSYQRLHDASMLSPSVALTLLQEVGDQIAEANLGRSSLQALRKEARPRVDRWIERISAWLPEPIGTDPDEIAYTEASARELAARRTIRELDLFGKLPNIDPEVIRNTQEEFRALQQAAIDSLQQLDKSLGAGLSALRREQAEELSRVASRQSLENLVDAGILPEEAAQRAAAAIEKQAGG